MPTAIETLSLEEVAALLGMAPLTLQRKYKSLVETSGFPLRLAGGRFYAPAIARYLAVASGMPDPRPADPYAEQRDHLRVIHGGRK
jgi:hypothetical protein